MGMDNTREKLIDIVECYADFLDWDTKYDIVDSIMELFATDNNVGDNISATVLCQNCTHHTTATCPENKVWCRRLSRYMDTDGFCSYGERREGDAE